MASLQQFWKLEDNGRFPLIFCRKDISNLNIYTYLSINVWEDKDIFRHTRSLKFYFPHTFLRSYWRLIYQKHGSKPRKRRYETEIQHWKQVKGIFKFMIKTGKEDNQSRLKEVKTFHHRSSRRRTS